MLGAFNQLRDLLHVALHLGACSVNLQVLASQLEKMGDGVLPRSALEHHLGALPLCSCFHGNTSGPIDQLSFEAFISLSVGISFDSDMTLLNAVKNSFLYKTPLCGTGMQVDGQFS